MYREALLGGMTPGIPIYVRPTCGQANVLLPEEMDISRKGGLGEWFVTDCSNDAETAGYLEPFLGDRNCWTQRFGDYDVRFYNPGGEGTTLVHDVTKVR